MVEGAGHRHLRRSLLRILLLAAGLIVGPALIVEGDLLVLPAVGLVLLAWVAIALVVLAHWLLTIGLPPIIATTTTAAHAAWDAVTDDPIGRNLHAVVARGARLTKPFRAPQRWLGRRVTMTPTGLPLTLALVVGAAGIEGLLLLSHRVDQPQSPVSRFDLRVAAVAPRLQRAGERRVMEAITNIGGTRSVLVVAAVLVAGALAARSYRSAALLVGTLALSSGLVTVLKASHARPRPALGQLVETSTSYPSGHAAASLSLAFGVLLWWHAARRRRPSLVAAVVVPLALLIGFSRAYLSIHWTSDVAAGWLCATVAVGVVLAADRATASRWPARNPRHPCAFAGAATVAVIAVGAIIVTGNHQFPSTVAPPAPIQLASTPPADLLAPLPHFSETLLGRRMEPLGLVIVANENQLRAAIAHAGWTVADTITPGRLLHTYWAGITGQADATAPVTPTFLDTRLEDLAIQQQSLGQGVKARHHARLWRLPLLTPGGCAVWGVTASLDDRVEWTVRTLFPNHHIAPAIDTEREYLASALASTGRLRDIGRYAFVGPTLGSNAAGDAFFSDGDVALLRNAGCG